MAQKRNALNANCDMRSYLFTSESVTMGHPDKVADRISDSILDAMLAQDPLSRVACETLVKSDMTIVAGEITSKAIVNIPEVVRETIKAIGYDDPELGFHYDNCAVLVAVSRQSPHISQGVTEGEGLHKEQGAGDQGLMFGYACRETPELMPMPILLAHKLTTRLEKMRQSKKLPWLRPDGKSQVTVEYEDGKPKRIHTILIATQHAADIKYRELRHAVIEQVIKPVLPARLLDKHTKFHVNATGCFILGGPKADCGVTGRKIIVDTYGGWGRHGGGCFSGKDPTKVDCCEVQLSYAIGVAQPISVLVNTLGTAKVSETRISEIVYDLFPLTPKGMIERLNLRRPIFAQTAYGGHFGRNLPDFTWEKTDMVEALKKAAGV
jgi:S-adenosylmethionine synthetase